MCGCPDTPLHVQFFAPATGNDETHDSEPPQCQETHEEEDTEDNREANQENEEESNSQRRRQRSKM